MAEKHRKPSYDCIFIQDQAIVTITRYATIKFAKRLKSGINWFEICTLRAELRIKFEQVLFWTFYKELGDYILGDEVIYAELLIQNLDLSCSVLRLWRHFLIRDEIQWDEIK